ncbi:copper resistance D family protein [Jannaschia sp. R86511]|uniref:copper resistance D family protein n=1 Tax=Jannaschia sp. R86511 TaxID=3093853 RepID=UPI0036D4325E
MSRPDRSAGPAPAGARGTGPEPAALLTTGLLLVVAGAVVTLGLLALTGGAAPTTLADPGPATTAGLPLARYLQDVLGVLTVGCTLVAAIASGAGETDLRARARRLLGPVASGWALVTLAVYLLTASDLSGRPLPSVLTAQVQGAFVSLPQARALLLVVLAGVVLAVASRLEVAAGPLVQRSLLVLAAGALVPPAFVGHSASAEDHELAVASVSVHLVAGALWIGGLAVLAVLVLADPRVRAGTAVPTVTSFSTLALWCVVVIGVSGLLNGSLRVSSVADLLGSAYGLLLLAKALLLAVLVGFGWWHRRRSIEAMTTGAGRSAFARLVVAELAVMVLTVAAAVVLARTSPPLG